jgi:hypothetical protein
VKNRFIDGLLNLKEVIKELFAAKLVMVFQYEKKHLALHVMLRSWPVKMLRLVVDHAQINIEQG